jgi:hypothetical protein
MPEQEMRSEDLCGKCASRSRSEGARNHAPVRDRGPGRLGSRWIAWRAAPKSARIKSSDDTVLCRVKGRIRGAIQPAVCVLSVDDWAWRKKQRYGTMLMDLERSQVIDLLPVRSADSFVRWLGLHPEVEVIARDRSSLYGGRQGASSSVQITDRYHLVSNLSEAASVISMLASANPAMTPIVHPCPADPPAPRTRATFLTIWPLFWPVDSSVHRRFPRQRKGLDVCKAEAS